MGGPWLRYALHNDKGGSHQRHGCDIGYRPKGVTHRSAAVGASGVVAHGLSSPRP